MQFYSSLNLAMSEANEIAICRIYKICRICRIYKICRICKIGKLSELKYWHQCGWIVIHHYFCGNYLCFNKTWCPANCLCCVCFCLFCKTRFIFYPARCLSCKCTYLIIVTTATTGGSVKKFKWEEFFDN